MTIAARYSSDFAAGTGIEQRDLWTVGTPSSSLSFQGEHPVKDEGELAVTLWKDLVCSQVEDVR